MEKKSKKNIKKDGTEETKDRMLNLDKIIKLDRIFRQTNPAKCTLEAILEYFKNDKDSDGMSKSSLYDYLRDFRYLYGAEFKGKETNSTRKSKDTPEGKKTRSKFYSFSYARWDGKSIYQYVDPEAPLPELEKMFGKVRDQAGEALMKALENEQSEGMSKPWHTWLRLFLDRMINEQSTALNVVSFYENIDLDDQNIHKFERLLKAILDKQPLKIHYMTKGQKHTDACVMPYRLKNYNQRWYLIAKCYNPTPNEKHPDEFYEGYSNYALDGIVDLYDIDGNTILVPAIANWDYKYIEPDNEDLDDYYYDMVGVTATKSGPKDVYLRFTPERYAYVETKPIVGSQSKNPVGIDHEYFCEDRVTIKLHAHLNKELEQQILSFGPDCEVVAPEELRNKIHDMISGMAALYDKQ